jgi:4-aminobutyrate aminotransferase-like enzyme
MTSRQTLALLRQFESRNITHVERDGSWPIVWERARGVNVWDAEGRKYLDLTAAFGVMAAGHANPRVVRAGQRQMARLLHAMGDVHPHAGKAKLARELSRISFERWAGRPLKRSSVEVLKRGSLQRINASALQRGKTIFCNSGFEAVEAALKTALLVTGRRGVIAFEGGYHGVGYGALNTTHREHFRRPFRAQLGQFGHFVPFPDSPAGLARVDKALRTLFDRHHIGAILVEPVQGRAGIRVPPLEFLPRLRTWCDRHGALLVLDEIFTGLGRTGRWFACEHSGVVPDLICLGKALAGGFPLSACVGRAELMDAAWPESSGEAIHTSTFLGHPVGCAMALAQISELRRLKLVERSARLGRSLLDDLKSQISNFRFQIEARGLGLMAGLELRHRDGSPATAEALSVVKRLLHCGFIVLPEGEHANVISFTPPLTITEAQLRGAVRALGEELRRLE